MKNNFRFLTIIALSLTACTSVYAQSDRFAYAVTDQKKDGSSWIVLRKIDIKTGEFSQVLIDGINKEASLYDATTRVRTDIPIKDTNQLYQPQLPFGTGVAAIAYDRKSNRVFFVPMYIDQLRYVDLATMKVYCVPGKGFYQNAGSKLAAANTLPRLVIAGDGYGYSVSNDGNHLYRFSTTGSPEITDLGSLIDHPANEHMTIHNACGGGGGDMIADDDGNLYVINAQNQVYKVDISSLEATWLGKVSGLPEKFSSNGAAVDDRGRILLSSSTYTDAWYTVDPSSWKAQEFKPRNGLYRSADLANSNLLVSLRTKNNQAPVFYSGTKGYVKLYPNPVEENRFMIRLTNMEPGEYSMQLTDVLGRTIIEKKIAVQTTTHTETVNFPPKTSVGIYNVRMVNRKNFQVFSEKLLLTRIE